jgi:hypothetical protein
MSFNATTRFAASINALLIIRLYYFDSFDISDNIYSSDLLDWKKSSNKSIQITHALDVLDKRHTFSTSTIVVLWLITWTIAVVP